MRWVRLDVNWPRNYKIRHLRSQKGGDRAALVWIAGICLAGEEGTDGYIGEDAVSILGARPTDVRLLEQAGLWHRNGTGWHIHGWSDYQPSQAEHQERSRRARWLACQRWHDPDCTCSAPPDDEWPSDA